ncbi:MAG: hypothetical protein ISS16_02860 [Ignavibacteria bacterium]|nr:hypothetical protein [Ignavibacteria bacterium]
MFKHSIFDLLITLTKKEKDRLSLFVRSPYFNQGRKLKKIFNEIIKHYPSFDSSDLTKENLGRTINPSGSYKDSAMRKILHELLQLVLRFIILERFNKMKHIQDDYLLKELSYRNQEKLFEKNEKRIESELMKADNISTEYLYKLHLLEANKFNFNILNSKVLKKFKADKEIKEMYESGKYFIIYFISEILNEYVELYFIGNKFNVEFDKLLLYNFIENMNLDDIIKNFPDDDKSLFIMEIYYSMYKAFSNFDNEEYYSEYKSLLLEHINKISPDEITEHFTNLVNYCSLKNKSTFKRIEFETELMNLYEMIINNEYYITDKVKYLPNDLFRNILFLSIRIRNIQWSLNFVMKYSKKLDPKDIENMSNFSIAYLFHEQKNYGKSLDYLNEVSPDNFNYPFDKKNLRLKNYYELDYSEQIFSEIDAYRKMLGKNEILSEDRKNRHRNFLTYLEKMVKYKTGNTKIDISFQKHKLKDEDQIIFKEWLLEKIEEIENEVSKKL